MAAGSLSPSGNVNVTTVTVPEEHAESFRREAKRNLGSAKDALADSLRLGDDEDVARDLERLDAAERLCATLATRLTFEVATAKMWWTVRETVVEGLWQAAEVVATQAEARDVDFAAAGRAYGEAGFYLGLLERLDSASVLADRPAAGVDS